MKAEKEKMKNNGSIESSMYEIYYFNKENNLELGCVFNGTDVEVYDTTIENLFDCFAYFVVLKNNEFVYASEDNMDSTFIWKEVFYYRHFEDYVLLPKFKQKIKIR